MPLDNFRSVYLPYCLEKQANGSYAVLNREYKPVGFNTPKFVSYENYPVTAKINGINSVMAQRLSYNASGDTDRIFLYNDSCIPTDSHDKMQSYLDKLAIVAKLRFAVD